MKPAIKKLPIPIAFIIICPIFPIASIVNENKIAPNKKNIIAENHLKIIGTLPSIMKAMILFQLSVSMHIFYLPAPLLLVHIFTKLTYISTYVSN